MADQANPESRTSIETVVQAFTDSELALREISASIARFRTAATQLGEAREDQAAARVALAASTAAAEQVASQVQGVVKGLEETVAVLRAIEPERLWRQLQAIETKQEAAASEATSRLEWLSKRSQWTLFLSLAAAIVGVASLSLLISLIMGVATIR